MKRFLISLAALLLLSSTLNADDTLLYRKAAVTAETDPIVGAVTGIVKSDGAGNISAAGAGTDYLAPNGSAANLTDFPTLNQNTTGTAAGLSGTPALPNGTTATTQAAGDNSTKLATTAYADAKVADAINDGTTAIAPSQNAVYDGLAGKVANDGTVNPTNLLSNASFENWGAGASAAPDGWTLTGAGAAVARESSIIKIGAYSAKITRSGTDAVLYVTGINSLGTYVGGRTFTFGCWVYATVANRARIKLGDQKDSDTFSSYHSGNSTWQFLTVTKTCNVASSSLDAVLVVDTGDTSAYFDGAMLVEGASQFAFSPKPAQVPVYRGDPASMDVTQASLTMDNAWHDLDLSAIVGTGQKLIFLFISVQDGTVGAYFHLRKNGQSNANNISGVNIIVANQYHYLVAAVFCDTSGVIEYKASETFSNINITIIGWIG